MELALNQDLCIRCGRCMQVCPAQVFARPLRGAVVIAARNLPRCIECGLCAAVCPKAAVTLNNVDPLSLQGIVDAPLTEAQRDMLFKARRSVRAYKDESVPVEVVLAALEDARYAPTASNSQQVEWILVEGREKMRALGSLWAAHDCSAALSYLELALHSRGVGTCWTGYVLAAAARGADLGLPLPEGRQLCAGLMIGYPVFGFERLPPRKPVRLALA